MSAPHDPTPDMGDREELVDIIDCFLRVETRADAERIADGLCAVHNLPLLRRLSYRLPDTGELA